MSDWTPGTWLQKRGRQIDALIAEGRASHTQEARKAFEELAREHALAY